MMTQKMAVIGCGQMGLGLAECAAAAGVHVVAVKITPGDIAGPRMTLKRSLDKRVERNKLSADDRDGILARIQFTGDLDAIRDCEIVVESCVEELQAKGEVLARIEAHMAKTAVLTTNTSSLRLRDLSAFLTRPSQFLGLHFFNPVTAMKLCEVSPTPATSPGATGVATQFCEQIGKTPVRIQDTPGYVVNRLLVPYLLHAIETLEHGTASAEAIDVAMKLGCGHPMGPLALADLIGLDVVFAMAKTLHTELRDTRYRAPSLLRRLVLAGHLGRKVGRGVYDYTNPAQPVVNPAITLGGASATGT